VKKLIITVVCGLLIVCAHTAYAGGSSTSCEGYKGQLLNRCVGHPDNSRDNPYGVGADVLIHRTEHVDLIAEYKYDINNEEHSIFGVFKTTTSIVEFVRDFFGK